MRKGYSRYGLFAILLSIVCLNPGLSADDTGQEGPTIEKVLRDINGGPVIPNEANRIYIPLFEDRSKKEGLAEKLRVRIKESFSRELRLAVVDNAESSDVRLEGRITGFQIQNTAFNALGITEKKRMRITASFKLIKTQSRNVIFSEPDIQSFKEFSDTVPPIENEVRVFEEVIEDLAKRITAKTVSGWYTELMTPIEKGKSR